MNRFVRATLIAPLTAPVLYWAGTGAVAAADPDRRADVVPNLFHDLPVVMVWGAPVAYVVTVAVALPALWLLRRHGPLTAERTVAVGLVVGLLTGLILAPQLRGDLITVPMGPWIGVALGAASAAVWWLLARDEKDTT